MTSLLKSALLTSILISSSWGNASVPEAVSGFDLKFGRQIRVSLKPDSKAKQKASVIVFLSARCPCSKSHEDHLAQLAAEFSDIQFIGVHSNANETSETDAKYFASSQIPFSVVQDLSGQVANQFSALNTPHAFIVGPNQKLLYQGGVSDSHSSKRAKSFYLKAALEDIRAGKDPNPSTQRVLGCAISRHSPTRN
jgi:hypothetical protein